MLFRKFLLTGAIVALLATSAVTFAAGDPGLQGCYVEASVEGAPVTTVTEGVDFLATVKCTAIPAGFPVFGFEFGTTFTSSVATVSNSTYTPGSFVTDALNGTSEGTNLRSGLYAVTRQGVDVTGHGDFTLGSFPVHVPFGQTSDSDATITLPIGTFKLSNNLGGAITDDYQTDPDAIVTITNLDIAMLDGTIKVKSDGTMSNLSTISLDLGTPDVGGSGTSTDATELGSFKDFTVSGLQYYTAHLGVLVTVSMESHLSCTVTDTLVDGPHTQSVIGTNGIITLYAGDASGIDNAINGTDATAIGANYGLLVTGGSSAALKQNNINGDSVIDIYDLVQVGRNYGQHSATCGVSTLGG